MSTILDALRRLEEERRKSRQVADPLREALEPVAAPGRPPPSTRRQAAWLGVVVLVLVASVLVTYRLARREDRQGGAVRSAAPAEALRIPTGEQTVARLPSPPSSELSGRAAGSVSPPPGEAPIEPDPRETARRPDRTDFGAVPFPDTRPAPAPILLSPDEQTELEIAAEAPMVGAEEIAPPAIEEIPREELEPEEAALEPRRATAQEEQGIRISAVVWSPEPESRFAVVNLRTLREGDEISGRVVDEIQPDGVIFVEGSERYKVLLGRR